MDKPLRVWTGWNIYGGITDPHTGRPQVRVLVAERSKAAAARALNCTVSHLNTYCSETSNEEEVAFATAHPGVAFWRAMDHRDEWKALDA